MNSSHMSATPYTLPLSVTRFDEFDNCRDAWRQCQAWLNDMDKSRLAHNQAWTDAMLTQYADFFSTVESSPLNPAQARAVVNGEVRQQGEGLDALLDLMQGFDSGPAGIPNVNWIRV